MRIEKPRAPADGGRVGAGRFVLIDMELSDDLINFRNSSGKAMGSAASFRIFRLTKEG
jgi:hypothetical protein